MSFMSKRKDAVRNFTIAVTANFISMSVTALLILIVPKFIAIEDYSYWQLYILYVAFVGFLSFGWADGVYLRYGGTKYEELDTKVIASQFWLLLGLQSVISLGLLAYGLIIIDDENKGFIIALVGLNCVLINMRTFIQLLLQGTDRILVFSRTHIWERIAYLTLFVLMISSGVKDYEYLILADALTKLVTLIVLCYICRNIIVTNIISIKAAIFEARLNIEAGIQLMTANIAGLLIIGSVRLMIEKGWDIETFGKVSLTLSITNLLLIFIGAASIVLFPIIKNTDKAMLPKLYLTLRAPIMGAAIGTMALYYPLQQVFIFWLPQYSDNLIYIALLLPICIFELNTSLLTQTFLKAMRKERLILFTNLGSLSIAIVLALITVFMLKSIALAIISIVIATAARSIIAECILRRSLRISSLKDTAVEVAFVIYFMLISWYVGGVLSTLLFLPMYGLYIFMKRHTIHSSLNSIRGR